MIPVNDVIDRGWMIAQIDSMIKSKQALLGLDCKDKNMIGFAYDSGYMQCLVEIYQIVMQPIVKDIISDLPKEPEDDKEDEFTEFA